MAKNQELVAVIDCQAQISPGMFLNTGILALPLEVFRKIYQWQNRLFDTMLERSFRAVECAEILSDALDREPLLRDFFDLHAVQNGGRVATDYLLYGVHRRRQRWRLTLELGSETRAYELEEADLRGLTLPMRRATQEDNFVPLSSFLGDRSLARLSLAPLERWPRFEGPGIQRLEHACLLISSGATHVLIDPIALAVGGDLSVPGFQHPPLLDTQQVDAVLISHGHLDHWHIPTILRYGGSGERPVVVPDVPHLSLLTHDHFSHTLAALGQEVRVARWGETISIGDIEIDVLPFFGEQPTAGEPVPPPHVRNWGNCYRVNTPDFSALVLVDSGRDAMGSMEPVVMASVKQRGPPDIVLSCCRDIRKSPFFQEIYTFWMVLPVDAMNRMLGERAQCEGDSITLGPDGIARVCAISEAAEFAPYAHGYRGVGASIHDIGWHTGEPTEHEVLRRIERELTATGSRTQLWPWQVGDLWRPRCLRSC